MVVVEPLENVLVDSINDSIIIKTVITAVVRVIIDITCKINTMTYKKQVSYENITQNRAQYKSLWYLRDFIFSHAK